MSFLFFFFLGATDYQRFKFHRLVDEILQISEGHTSTNIKYGFNWEEQQKGVQNYITFKMCVLYSRFALLTELLSKWGFLSISLKHLSKYLFVFGRIENRITSTITFLHRHKTLQQCKTSNLHTLKSVSLLHKYSLSSSVWCSLFRGVKWVYFVVLLVSSALLPYSKIIKAHSKRASPPAWELLVFTLEVESSKASWSVREGSN